VEVGEGVFVSNVSTEEWEPDTDPGGEMHILCRGVEVYAGLSRFPVDWTEPVQWTLPAWETLLVLEGARIEIAGGPTLELRPGDVASLPKGADTTWHLTTPFKEFWVLA
jgi:ethanolamine utilization protein EutQ (cupin superfamily)